MNTFKTTIPFLLISTALAACSHAAVLLSTTLDGTTTSGTTLSGITYATSDGLTGASSISGSDALFATNLNSTGGHYVPDVQLDLGQWDVDLGFNVDSGSVQIDSIEIERQNFTSNGSFNTSTNRTYTIFVSLIGSVSGQVGSTVSVTVGPSPPNTTDTYSFGGVVISDTEDWTFNVQFNDGSGIQSGVYGGIDGFTINGQTIPEPSAALLGALGSLLLLLRRRR